MKTNVLSVLSALFLLVIFILLFVRFIFLESHYATAGSMRNTIHHGDYILSWKFVSLKTKDNGLFQIPLKRRDIVIFQIPGEKEVLIKRIIGLPGETLEFSEETVFINGIKLEESYITTTTYNKGRYYIPEGKVFVMGDNRPHSRDSREFGLVDIRTIKGKVFMVYFPFNRVSWFTSS